MRQMEERGLAAVDLRHDVQDRWFAKMQHDTEGTVWASGCESWYLDAEGRNAVLWPGFTFDFRRRTKHFDLACYDTAPVRSAPATAGGRGGGRLAPAPRGPREFPHGPCPACCPPDAPPP